MFIVLRGGARETRNKLAPLAAEVLSASKGRWCELSPKSASLVQFPPREGDLLQCKTEAPQALNGRGKTKIALPPAWKGSRRATRRPRRRTKAPLASAFCSWPASHGGSLDLASVYAASHPDNWACVQSA